MNKKAIYMRLRILSIIIVAIVGIAAKAQTIVESGDGWSLDSEGLLTVTKNIESVSYTGQPWSSNKSSIKSVVITEGVTSIGKYEFYGHSNLINVTFSNTVTSIGYGSFYGCSSIENITFPSSLTSIGYQSFYNCSGLTSIDIPNSVTNVGTHAFQGCSRLASVTLPSGIKTIGSNLLSGCKNLTSIVIPEGVTTIGLGAFSGCINLESVTIPSSVNTFDKSVFSGCSKLESVIIPNGVTSIGESMFNGCSGLKSITLPNTIKSIGAQAFLGCSSLIGTIEIPDGVTIIGNDAFSGCSSLSGIILPNSITTIGNNVFRNCTSITSFVIPNRLEEIGSYVFDGCSGIESITIPSNVAIIKSYSFKNCTNLKYVFLHQESVVEDLTGIFTTYKTIERFFVPDEILANYRSQYGSNNDLKDKFTGFSYIEHQTGDGDEELMALSLEKGSYSFIAWAVNSGEQVREGEEISIALTEDFDMAADNVSWQALGTAEHPFKGIFEGNGHTIVSLGETAGSKVASLFGTVGEGAKVENLTVGQASLDEEEGTVESGIHLEVSEASSVNDVVDGKRISYYGVLAQENHGTISNVVFVGDFGLSDDYSATDDISVSLVADNREDGVIDHCVAYFTNLVDDDEEPAGNKSVAGNKRKIIVMQNVGTGRNAGKVVKTASNGHRKAATKAVKPGSEPEFTNINDDYRIYTDEEMMTGEPAYWMNMTGRGYSGEYEGKWSMSLDGKFPVQKTDKNREVVKLVYEIEGLDEEEIESLGLDGASFARIGGEVKLTYNQSPKTISGALSVIGDEYAMLTVPELTAEDNGTVTVTLDYRSLATGMSEMKSEGREMKVTVKGHDVMLAGAEGREVTVTDVMGRQVYSKTASDGKVTLRLPSAGIYMVKAGDVVEKLVVR